LSSSQEAGGEASWLLVAPLVFFSVVVFWWRQWRRLGICARRVVAPVTLIPAIVTAVTSGAALAVATATPTALGDSILVMEFSDNPTIISIVGVCLVEDAVAVSSTLITLGAVPVTLLVVRLYRKGSSLLALGVF
jgi:hypothetical protein